MVLHVVRACKRAVASLSEIPQEHECSLHSQSPQARKEAGLASRPSGKPHTILLTSHTLFCNHSVAFVVNKHHTSCRPPGDDCFTADAGARQWPAVDRGCCFKFLHLEGPDVYLFLSTIKCPLTTVNLIFCYFQL